MAITPSQLRMKKEKEEEKEEEEEEMEMEEMEMDRGELPSNSMEAAIYRAAIAGDIDGLTTALQQDSKLNLLDQLTPRDDTILHIAARLGHHHLAEHIQSCCPNHFKSKNYNNDHPLHVAAAGGHLSIVQSLITNALRFAISSGREETEAEQDILDVIKGQNKQGNTPLHMAVKDHQYDVAFFLFRRPGNELTSCFSNLEKKSPLYMAAEAGHEELFKLMMQFVASNVVDAQNILKDGQPLLHVAITTRNKVVLEAALKSVPSLMDAHDRRGRRPLSYAASIGYVDGVCYIMNTFVHCTYERDGNGSYPIHEASTQGHIEVVKEFLRRFPDSRELLNRQGQNILHVAAKSGKANIVSYILKAPELEILINDTGQDGNTPLLLATKKAHAEIVSILTRDKRVRLEIENGEGFTALDAALEYGGTTYSIRERLTWMALRYASAPQGQPKTIKSEKNSLIKKKEREKNSNRLTWMALRYASAPQGQPKTIKSEKNSLIKKKEREKNSNMRSTALKEDIAPRWQPKTIETEKNSIVEAYKDRTNTFLLVATIIITVTFAAGITVPGGYDDSETHKGMALMVKKSAFQIFVITNAVAMYSSIIVAVLLIWAQLGDLNLILVSLKWASPLFGV